MALEHGEIFEHKGRRFRVHIELDVDADSPWERDCFHGPVRSVFQILKPDKRAGERVLQSNRGDHWLYDWAEAMRIAKRDGWGVNEQGLKDLERRHGRAFPNHTEAAVQADFDRLQDWFNDRWWYVGVCVELVNADGESMIDKYAHALWGIESDCGDYIEEVAHELADQCLAELGDHSEPWKCPFCGVIGPTLVGDDNFVGHDDRTDQRFEADRYRCKDGCGKSFYVPR